MCRFMLDWCAAADVLPLCVYVLERYWLAANSSHGGWCWEREEGGE